MMLSHYNLNSFKKDMEAFNMELSDKQMEQFITYYELLVEWNSFMNLTTITEYDEVIKKHFVDSISMIKVYDMNKDVKVIDIGTGAGFPGIPLKIAFPDLKITLMDSLNKRVKFLNEVINKLDLKDMEAIHSRAEDLSRNMAYREQFDICVSRAVANLATLSEYCLPFVKIGGQFISYKSEKTNEELAMAAKAIEILGGKLIKQTEFCLPYSDIHRHLISIEKVKKTSKDYPRKAGLPSKEPLK